MFDLNLLKRMQKKIMKGPAIRKIFLNILLKNTASKNKNKRSQSQMIHQNKFYMENTMKLKISNLKDKLLMNNQTL